MNSDQLKTNLLATIAAACASLCIVAATSAERSVAENGEWIQAILAEPILEPGAPLRELRSFVASRIPDFAPPESKTEWQSRANTIRRELLENVFLRGEASKWRKAKLSAQWLDSIPGDADYVIRKFRYEALPGMWFPALLYEPTQLRDKAPVCINVNGHDKLGKATPEKQRRCINLAKRGILAFSFEFLEMNQLQSKGNRHNSLMQIDLCGTSGVAPFLLALTRGLDVALAHPHADAERVGVAGLSGGGWQSIVLAALDERITLANPVAGYSSMHSRIEASRDVGDSEQIPTDLCTVADYTHLTALVAPRPLLLTYNAKDNCCFLPETTLPMLENAGRPMYRMYDAEKLLRTHINYEPGTHNFERDNREAFYRLLRDCFYSGDKNWTAKDIPLEDAALKSSEELLVPLPAGNATLHTLALQLSRSLPKGEAFAQKGADALQERAAARERLRRIVRTPKYETKLIASGETTTGSIRAKRWSIEFDDEWTLPAVEFIPDSARVTTILFGDEGRAELQALIIERLARQERVFAVDPLAFGEAFCGIKAMELQMVSTVGERPLGIQAAQISALAALLQRREPEQSVTLTAVGPRAGLVALVTAALEPDAISGVSLIDSWDSLKEFIRQNMEFADAPEFATFALLEEFDIPRLETLISPRPVVRAARR
jgi:dienelactone hydrolase